MRAEAVARSYARALHKSSDNPLKLLTELKKIAAVIENVDGVNSYLECPRLKKEDKDSFIKFLEESLSLNSMLVSFMKILLENERFSFFNEIAFAFEEIVLSEKNTIKAFVYSAADLKDQEKNELQKALEKRIGKDVVIEYKIEEELLSGIRVEADNKIFDGSLKHRMRALKDSMIYKVSAGGSAG